MPRASLLKTALDVRWSTPSSHLPPTFLLPIRARSRLHQATTTPFQNTPPEIPPLSALTTTSPHAQYSPIDVNHTSISKKPPVAPKLVLPVSPAPIAEPLHVPDAYTHLTSQSPYYITAHIHSHPYLLTTGDTLRLPFHMPLVLPGDILRLNRASVFGSRDYTLKGAPYIDERLFVCRVRVMGVESEPMRIKEKTKRRQRRVKKVRSKHRYTVVRVMEVRGRSERELEEMRREVETAGQEILGGNAQLEQGRSEPGEVEEVFKEMGITEEQEKEPRVEEFKAAKYGGKTEREG